MSSAVNLSEEALSLADAVLEHARLVDELTGDEPGIFAATMTLRQAAWRYAAKFMECTDHGNPFGQLEKDDEEDNDAADEGAETDLSTTRDSWDVSVDAQYVVRIENLHSAAALARARMTMRGQRPCNDLATPSDVVYSLFSVDGWDPYSYDQSVLEVMRLVGSVEICG